MNMGTRMMQYGRRGDGIRAADAHGCAGEARIRGLRQRCALSMTGCAVAGTRGLREGAEGEWLVGGSRLVPERCVDSGCRNIGWVSLAVTVSENDVSAMELLRVDGGADVWSADPRRK